MYNRVKKTRLELERAAIRAGRFETSRERVTEKGLTALTMEARELWEELSVIEEIYESNLDFRDNQIFNEMAEEAVIDSRYLLLAISVMLPEASHIDFEAGESPGVLINIPATFLDKN
jgi:hypothetical protein